MPPHSCITKTNAINACRSGVKALSCSRRLLALALFAILVANTLFNGFQLSRRFSGAGSFSEESEKRLRTSTDPENHKRGEDRSGISGDIINSKIIDSKIINSNIINSTIITTTSNANANANANANTNNYEHSNIIYGHLHIPKTGGTTVNGMMAAKYERVCGNKGFSFDAYQANIRAHTASKQDNPSVGAGYATAWDYKQDKYGYEDCDYISHEIKWNFWPDTMRSLNAALEPVESLAEQAQNYYEPPTHEKNKLVLELHVPCRDPIDHLLSMANHGGTPGTIRKPYQINCTGVETDDERLEQEVNRAYFDYNRFSPGWNAKNRKNKYNIQLKCFQAIPVEPYIDYMGKFLQTRRIPSAYFHHATNAKRNKAKECVRNLSETTLDKIRAILIKNYPYMNFCSTCMGTEEQLAL